MSRIARLRRPPYRGAAFRVVSALAILTLACGTWVFAIPLGATLSGQKLALWHAFTLLALMTAPALIVPGRLSGVITRGFAVVGLGAAAYLVIALGLATTRGPTDGQALPLSFFGWTLLLLVLHAISTAVAPTGLGSDPSTSVTRPGVDRR